MEQLDPGSSVGTMFQSESGEPQDHDELEVFKKFKFRHHLAREAEQMISVIFNHNGMDEIRNQIKQDVFDFGVAIYKDWIDNGSVKIRNCRPENMVVSKCRFQDYRDVRYVGEVREMLISDLAKEAGDQFSIKDYNEIANAVAGHYDNPKTGGANIKTMNDFRYWKIRVLDLEWYSVDHLEYASRINKSDNLMVSRRSKRKEREEDGVTIRSKSIKMVYKGSWIIGTDYIYNHGRAKNMKRDLSNLSETKMSYHIFSPEFDDGFITSTGHQVIPLIDQFHLLWYKYQMFVSQFKGDGIIIEMGAIEDIPLGS
jgi:hypothetical protein